eukprot:TRINITY_DN11750_c0_g3_i1.p1 TRINITY_DN11750_c0_g3~~TRINITY_DN11750_c0_g3_i1.p1  ORF type:complete len:291 (-),score=69.40 TRINITY_DN11750_c0_g3_i1:75-947(-)
MHGHLLVVIIAALAWTSGRYYFEVIHVKDMSEIPQINILLDKSNGSAPTIRKFVELVVISDTHNQHDAIESQLFFTPKSSSADVKEEEHEEKHHPEISTRILVHCGDFSNTGSLMEGGAFNEWCGSESVNAYFDHKLLVSGNHDRKFWAKMISVEDYRSQFTNIRLLNDELIEIEGITFFGAEYYPDNAAYAALNTPCDVLITHVPPLGYCDSSNWYVGSQELRDAIFDTIKPKLHLFGHVHKSRGSVHDDEHDVWFANCANAGFMGWLKHPPVRVVIELILPFRMKTGS